ncbi:oxidoreductase [Streptomyces sp. NPDC058773]|uniref:oxidoreductase n=1 Tax=Streptomyces sp. NPDC058773 TaxID=3346632 RepID=UPI0036CD4DF9
MSAEPELNGQVAVVTGGGRGIGRAVCRELLAAGVRVVAGSRKASVDLADSGAAEGHLVAVDVDLATADGPRRLVQEAMALFGRVDVLVNNVGGFPDGAPRLGGFRSVSDEDWARTFDFNVLSAVRAVRAVLPPMLAQGRGAIVNVSSINARLPAPNVIDYSAAKAALNSLSKSLSAEFAASGIRVNTVSPGPVLTPQWTAPGGLGDQLSAAMGTDSDSAMAAMAEAIGGIPMGRFGTAAEIARVVVFLASPAAGYIAGSDIVIDGGLVKTL